MPQAPASRPGRRRRIDRDRDAHERRRRRDARRLDRLAPPQSVGPVLDQLALELLAPEPRAAVGRRDLRQEPRREVAGIVGGRRRRRHDAGRVDEPPDQRDRPRRRRDGLARAVAQAQPELQHVPGLLRVAPLAELVRPGGLELRPAQAIRVLGREGVRDGARRPFEPAQRRLPLRPLGCGRDREEPGRAVDHHVAHVGHGLADERDAPDALRRDAAKPADEARHPRGAGARLAGAAPAEEEPGVPGRVLVRAASDAGRRGREALSSFCRSGGGRLARNSIAGPPAPNAERRCASSSRKTLVSSKVAGPD